MRFLDKLELFVVDDEAEKKDLEKYANFAYLFDIWLKNIEDGKHLSSFFEQRGYKNIVIYGMGILGKHFVEQLKNTDIQVIYIIERMVANVNGKNYGCKEANELLEQPDAIVVTPIMEYETIKKLLTDIYRCDIISAEEVILSI